MKKESTSKIVIKLGAEFLTKDNYKMLSPEGVAKVQEIVANAKEDTIIELPQGLLFMNISRDDCYSDDCEVVVKVPETVIGLITESPCVLLPSFLEDLDADSNDIDVKDYYKASLPKRKAKIAFPKVVSGKMVDTYKVDKDKANELAERMRVFGDEWEENDFLTDETGGYDGQFFCSAPGPRTDFCSLEIEGLSLPLYGMEMGMLMTNINDEEFTLFSKDINYEDSDFSEGGMVRIIDKQGSVCSTIEIECYDPCKLERLSFLGDYDEQTMYTVGYDGDNSWDFDQRDSDFSTRRVAYCYGSDGGAKFLI